MDENEKFNQIDDLVRAHLEARADQFDGDAFAQKVLNSRCSSGKRRILAILAIAATIIAAAYVAYHPGQPHPANQSIDQETAKVVDLAQLLPFRSDWTLARSLEGWSSFEENVSTLLNDIGRQIAEPINIEIELPDVASSLTNLHDDILLLRKDLQEALYDVWTN